MHSGYEIPGIQHQQPPENTWNQTHILEQIHTLPATQQLLLDEHHFLQHQTRPPGHHYASAAASPPYFQLNFKLGLNEICTINNRDREFKNGTEENGLLRGNEQYEPDTSLGMLHSWQNQQDSAIKQQPFWEALPAEVSNENSEIVDRQDNIEMNQKELAPTNSCLHSKNEVHFSELEAIYTSSHHNQTNQTGPKEILHVPLGMQDPAPEASIEEQVVLKNAEKKRKKKKKKKENSYNDEFLGELMKQVMDHQENLHRKFAQVIEKLDEERRAREDAWRNQELARFEQEAKARARNKALVESREAMIVSYMEKITGQKLNLRVARPAGTQAKGRLDCTKGHIYSFQVHEK